MKHHLTFTSKVTGPAVIISPMGNLDTKHASNLQDYIESAIAQNALCHIILNLANVEYLSSSCLSVFVNSARQLLKNERLFLICNANSAIIKVLEIIKVDKLIRKYDTEGEAMAAVYELSE